MSEFIKCGVIGHPIGHSKSPQIHNYWIDAYGLKGMYEAIDIAPANLEDGIKRLIDEGYKGFNATVPHKEAVMNLCHDVAHNAQAIGAVNTVVVEGGNLRGLNTDCFGFLHNIWECQPEFEFSKKTAVILGAGGATRAIISALIGEQIDQIILLNRTRARAEIISQEMNFTSDLIMVEDWDQRESAIARADILVNCTSLGMEGQAALELNLGQLPAHALVNDIVYAPLETDLIKAAQDRGHIVVTGIGMLIHQARPAFKEWFGLLPDVTDELRHMVLQ